MSIKMFEMSVRLEEESFIAFPKFLGFYQCQVRAIALATIASTEYP